MPLPYGGKFRQVMVDLNPDALYAKQLSPADVSNALGLQNRFYPAGTAKIGDKEFQVKLNSSPRVLDDLNNLPIRVINGAPIYMRDIGQVRDGYAVQTNVVRTNGAKGALLTVLRNGKAIYALRGERSESRPAQDSGGPPQRTEVRQLFDQSLFVRGGRRGGLREGGYRRRPHAA